MTDSKKKAEKHQKEITECPICQSAFVDPRVLPCIHTFCFKCLKGNADAAQKKSGDKMPCPLCRKDFVIPEDGVNGAQKNSFIENLLMFKVILQMGNATIICDMCNVRNGHRKGQISKAAFRCLQCQDNYCLSCMKVHQFLKVSKDHQLVNVGSDANSEMKQPLAMKFCSNHTQKPLDYYCADCKKIVCVSCFVLSHASHKCKDVTTVDEEFRKTIDTKSLKISSYVNELLLMINNEKERKAEFLKQMIQKEAEILKRNKELIDIIEKQTKSLLEELSAMKSNHLKEIETQMEDIERCRIIMESFKAYCTELTLKGSVSDICSSVDQIIVRADELEKDHEAFIGRSHQVVEVSIHATGLENASTNLIRYIKEMATKLENFAVVVGINDGIKVTTDVIKVNLHRSNEVSTPEHIPFEMETEAVAAVYRNTMYVTGIGTTNDEIYKYNSTSGWMKCASLVQGRRRHSAAFIDETLYICGGFVDSSELILKGVEAFNAVTNKCIAVGKLVHGVESSGNCVPFKSSLFIFGGLDKGDNKVSHVQLYNTKDNTCRLISNPMPRPCHLVRAVLWEAAVIVLGRHECFIFNIESETWQDRVQFKTDVCHFGLALENKRIFVIGGGICETDKYGDVKWKCRDDVRYVPLQNILDDDPIAWEVHASLPQPALIQAYGKLTFFVS